MSDRASDVSTSGAAIRSFGDRRTFTLLIAGAVALRIGAFIAAAPLVDFGATNVIHGSTAYDTYARNLISTGTFGLKPGVPDAVLPPLYGWLLAAVYRIVGRRAWTILLLNTMLDVGALVAIRRIGARLFTRGPFVGTLAVVFTAAYPYLIFQTLSVVDTSLFIALTYLLVAAVVDVRDARSSRETWGRGLAAGFIFGLASLTRPILPPFIALAGVWVAFTVGTRSAIRRLIPVAVGVLVVTAPWIARNSLVFGRPVGLTTNGGSNLWQGNNAETIRYLRAGYDVQWIPGPSIVAPDRLGPAADGEFLELTLDYWRTHLRELPSLVWTKLRVQWSVDVSPARNPGPGGQLPEAAGDVNRRIDDRGGLELGGLPAAAAVATYSQPLFDRVGRTLHRAYWGALLVLALVGLWITRKSWRDVSLLWFLPLSLTVVYVVTHPSTRYRVPGDPACFLFSASALAALRRRTDATSIDTVQPAVCWLGGGRYTQPLDASMARKWTALSSIGLPLHVVGFADGMRTRRFHEGATFHLLPDFSIATARYLTMFLVAPIVMLRLALEEDAWIFVAQSPYEAAIAAVVKMIVGLTGRPVVLIVESMGDFEEAFFLYRHVPLEGITRALMQRIAAFGLRHADLGRGISDATQRQLQASAPSLAIETFPAWVNSEPFAQVERSAPPSCCRDVLFVGTLAPIKGLHVLVEAFARVQSRIQPARLIVRGGTAEDGPYRASIDTLIRERGLSSVVTFVDALPDQDLAMLMSRARVVVVPSLSEGLSRVAIEAMLTGTPVIASRVGGLPEVVHDGENGYLVPARDVDALAAALVRAFEDEGIDAMGLRARSAAARLSRADSYVANHARLFDAARQRLREN
jgi:glycosyltransferase involved in cell wall biosynthesis/4-amino-4-deoxy-L-arabinose transferase-like glycosyltransferase